MMFALVVVPFYMAATPANAAGTTAYFGLSPSSGTFARGSEFVVNVTINLSNNYNASTADVYYNNARFQYVSASIGPAYNGDGSVTLKSNGYGSYIALYGSRNKGGPINGGSVLASIRFRAISNGGAYLNFGAKRVILYPTTEYTTAANNGNYAVVNPPPPAPPTPPPSPKPTPRAPVIKAPSQSPAAPSGLQISDFLISDVAYTSAKLSWKTNKPASTKVNFNTEKSDLFLEKSDDSLKTDHSIILTESDLRAGSQYYLRITSNDASGAVTIDGEFNTQYIPVIIKITDENNNVIPDVSVTIEDQIVATDDDGEASFALSNGEVPIYVSNEEITREFTANIEVPAKDSNTQIVTLALSDENSAASTTSTQNSGSISVWRIIAIVLVLIAGGALVFFFIIKRRVLPSKKSHSDPLEAENYTRPVAPPTLPSQQPKTVDTMELPIGQTEHHASIAEMLKSRANHDNTDPALQSASPPPPTSPTGAPIPKHASLKDMVTVPEKTSNTAEPELAADPDLPIAPIHIKNDHPKSDSSEQRSDTLTIPH